jgi:hypothetical protein
MRDSEKDCIAAKELGMRCLNYCDQMMMHGNTATDTCDSMMREVVMQMDKLINHIVAQRSFIKELKGNG